MAKQKWYAMGYDDGMADLPSDPPWRKGHRDYENYMAGYDDGQKQLIKNLDEPYLEAE